MTFSVRHSRWRTWLWVHKPNLLYDRLGPVLHQARDCGDHEWDNAGSGTDGCHHCQAERPSVPAA